MITPSVHLFWYREHIGTRCKLVTDRTSTGGTGRSTLRPCMLAVEGRHMGGEEYFIRNNLSHEMSILLKPILR